MSQPSVILSEANGYPHQRVLAPAHCGQILRRFAPRDDTKTNALFALLCGHLILSHLRNLCSPLSAETNRPRRAREARAAREILPGDPLRSEIPSRGNSHSAGTN